MKRIKKKEHENLSNASIKKVIELLEAEKPITKKEACEILNISYNTTRLNKILEDFKEREAYTAKRKAANRGKPATDAEIAEAVKNYLNGESVTEIAKSLYRSPGFVKSMLERIGVPQRPSSAEEKLGIDYIPEECTSETFEQGERVWSARHHAIAVVREELSNSFQESKPGYQPVDYEARYGSKCYAIYVLEDVDSEDSLFPGVETGGYNAYSLAYDLAKLSHLEKYGVDLKRL